MGRKKPKLNRRSHVIEPKPRFIIFCEGKNTEPGYFGALKNKYKNALISIETHDGVGVPITIANRAVDQSNELKLSKDSYEEADQVWAVFDRDVHHKYRDAIAHCENNNVGVGRSNPCFELWLILHIEDYDSPNSHKAVQKYFQKCHSKYNRKGNKTPDYPSLLEQIEKAETRAEKQFNNRVQEGSPLRPPYTTIFLLTRAIREAAEGKS